jgi:hypothetical protein
VKINFRFFQFSFFLVWLEAAYAKTKQKTKNNLFKQMFSLASALWNGKCYWILFHLIIAARLSPDFPWNLYYHFNFLPSVILFNFELNCVFLNNSKYSSIFENQTNLFLWEKHLYWVQVTSRNLLIS